MAPSTHPLGYLPDTSIHTVTSAPRLGRTRRTTGDSSRTSPRCHRKPSKHTPKAQTACTHSTAYPAGTPLSRSPGHIVWGNRLNAQTLPPLPPEAGHSENDRKERSHADRQDRPDEEEPSARLRHLADASARHVEDGYCQPQQRPEQDDDVPRSPLVEHQCPVQPHDLDRHRGEIRQPSLL